MVDHANATIVLAENQEQVDKILKIKENLPKLQKVIFDAPKSIRHYCDPLLIDLKAIQAQDRQWGKEQPNPFEEQIQASQAQETVLLPAEVFWQQSMFFFKKRCRNKSF